MGGGGGGGAVLTTTFTLTAILASFIIIHNDIFCYIAHLCRISGRESGGSWPSPY